jgi:hypothetical protein
MNVEHPDDMEEDSAQDENAEASDDSEQQAENAPTQAASPMGRSVSIPVIINK